jgi:hypothetical protein
MSDNFAEESFHRLKSYSDDLSERLRLLDAWKLRHPDCDSKQYRQDALNWDDDIEKVHNFQSTFDPNDDRPDTYDTISAQRFNDLILVALKAYEQAAINE